LKLYRKLLLFTLAAALLPLTAVGFAVLAGAERALLARIGAEQAATARGAAEQVGRDLEVLFDGVEGVVHSWRPGELSPEELRALPLLLCRQSRYLHAVALVDAGGRPVVPPFASTETAPLEDRPAVSAAGMAAFLAAIPREEAIQRQGSLLLTPAYQGPEGRPQVVLARSLPGRGGAPWVVGALVGLEGLQARVEAAAGSAGAAAVLDPDERLVVGSPGLVLEPEDRAEAQRLRAGPPGGGSYRGSGATTFQAAWASVPGSTGWGVFLRLPAAQALAEVARMRRNVLGTSFVSLAALFFLGWVFVRRITRGLARIDRAARELGGGNMAVRLPESGRDEVAEVSRTFNRMGAELQQARAKLERWNEELRAEVEARTRELKEAQAQLLESQKLAAIGQLGAGVAHEINNPLTGILGQAQLLLERKGQADPEAASLRRIEDLARRSREITQNLLRFSQQRAEPDFQRLELNGVVREALTLAEGQIRDAGVSMEVSLGEDVPPVRGDAGHLSQVLLHLLSNARAACAGRQGARITVSTSAVEGQACLEVKDTGKGIPPDVLPRIFEPFFTTKEVWSNVGLGLSVSFRIVSEHGGRFRVDSRPGEGSTFRVLLPPHRAAV